jgi:hypothetical protein
VEGIRGGSRESCTTLKYRERKANKTTMNDTIIRTELLGGVPSRTAPKSAIKNSAVIRKIDIGKYR